MNEIKILRRKKISTVKEAVFGRNQNSAPESTLFSGQMIHNYTTCRWPPTSSEYFIT